MFQAISRLFSRKPPAKTLPQITDPFFGTLTYFSTSGLWAGKIFFDPLDIETELLIDAPDSGPSEPHREFYQQLLARWPAIQTSVGDIVLPPIKKWAKADFDESCPWSYFQLKGLRIPNASSPPAEWALSYWCPAVKHHFDIQMLDWSAESLDINRR